MFGNSAKVVWEHWLPADDQNRLLLATRALLVITQKETILFDPGIGAYMDPRIRDRYGVEEPGHVLLQSLSQKGISPKDITRIFISHLHFDHAGGLLSAWQAGKEAELLFPNANYYVSEAAWERANHPHLRDRASFTPQLNAILEQSQRLHLVGKGDLFHLDEFELQFLLSEGHTPGLLCADLHFNRERLVYASDLIPGRFWVHLPISMGYDRFPELLIDEKKALLTSLAEDHAILFYGHDPDYAFSRVQVDSENRTFKAVDAQKELVFGAQESNTGEMNV
jgi:glyoxylase-like metal-dependent hydrolase (beta-lactamase superfamily II)